MNILALTAFADNYIWLLHNGRQALVVDPGLAAPVVQALKALNLELVSILVTHHHGDHVGGVAELVNATGATVYGPAHENLGVDCQPLEQASPCIALGLNWQVLDVPGHTAGHIAYFHPDVAGVPVLFCGDTLFSGGCGRLFEGKPAQMLASLDQIAALPGNTQVYCAHEYTLSNLRFALAVEPGNTELQAYEAHCQALRAAEQATLPSTIVLERQINPFLRSREPSVRHAVQTHQATAHDDVAVFAALRQWKNEFK